jgi:hypothetical protein
MLCIHAVRKIRKLPRSRAECRFYFVGDAPIDQTSQGVRVTGDYSSNKFAIAGATLRYDF